MRDLEAVYWLMSKKNFRRVKFPRSSGGEGGMLFVFYMLPCDFTGFYMRYRVYFKWWYSGKVFS